MTVSSFRGKFKGSNMNISQEYYQNATLTASLNDGLHDTAIHNYSYLGAENRNDRTEEYNKLILEAELVVSIINMKFLIISPLETCSL